MRTIRGSALVLAIVALSPAIATAQANRPFADSWFWGAKVGALAFSTTRIENGFAPSVGADWLITRSKGALYVSLDRAFFSEQSTISDPGSLSGESVVDVKDLTRLSFSLLAFPKPNNSLRPYGGVGLALNFIGSAEASGSGGSAFSAGAIEDARSRASFQVLAGVQKQLSSMSLFGQVVMLPFETDFLLNGRSGYSLELGVRWNAGGAIDKLH
jgi:hypothetical protein